jgi:hypothetical protein
MSFDMFGTECVKEANCFNNAYVTVKCSLNSIKF